MRRPQQHVRRVHTRLGVRPVVVNRGIHYKTAKFIRDMLERAKMDVEEQSKKEGLEKASGKIAEIESRTLPLYSPREKSFQKAKKQTIEEIKRSVPRLIPTTKELVGESVAKESGIIGIDVPGIFHRSNKAFSKAVSATVKQEIKDVKALKRIPPKRGIGGPKENIESDDDAAEIEAQKKILEENNSEAVDFGGDEVISDDLADVGEDE